MTTPNPLPAGIDWARVESTLGLTIVESLPDDHDAAATSSLDFDDRYRDARRDEDARVLRVRNVDPSRAIAIDSVLDSLEEDAELLVVVDPVLVRAIGDLVGHGASVHSVSKSPEPSDADSPVSPESGASVTRVYVPGTPTFGRMSWTNAGGAKHSVIAEWHLYNDRSVRSNLGHTLTAHSVTAFATGRFVEDF